MQNNGQQGGKKNIIYLFAFESTVAFFLYRKEKHHPYVLWQPIYSITNYFPHVNRIMIIYNYAREDYFNIKCYSGLQGST